MTKKAIQVLLVEDDSTLNDAFTIILKKEGFDVISAFDGSQALAATASSQPDIVLLDLLMPIMNGKEFLQQFENKNNIPIIVFSNLDSKDEVKEAIELGATKYMLKAWATPSELIKVIKDSL